MFFWFGFLTILASILYFSFYPRNDPLQVIDKPIADSLTAPLIAQHMAALKDASIIVYREKNQVNNSHAITQKYILEAENTLNPSSSLNSFNSLENAGSYFKVTDKAIKYYLPKGIERNTAFYSYITCFSNGQLTNKCGCTNENGEEKCTTDFLITIGKIPSEWGYYGKLAPRALAERLFLTKYTEDTNLPVTCGILDCSGKSPSGEDFFPNSSCSIYTTRYQDVRVPDLQQFLQQEHSNINSSSSTMVCISRLSVTYKLKENPAEIIYP